MLLDPVECNLSWRKSIVLNMFMALIYVLLGNTGIIFSSYNASSSPIWPPSGLALALVLMFGMAKVIPGIVLGVAILALQRSAPLVTSVGLIASALLEASMAAMLLQAVGKGKFRFRRPVDILFFIGIAGIFAPFVSSTVAITFLYIGNMTTIQMIPKIWITWIVTNSLGILLFTPLVLSFFRKKQFRGHFMEGMILFVMLVGLSYWSFEGESIRKFTLVPLLTWAALRFSFRGVSMASILVGSIAIWRSTFLWGVFDSTSPEADLLWIQCLTAGITIVGYFMATVMEVQEEAESKELELSLNLVHKKIAEEAFAILDQSINKSPIGFALIDKDLKYMRINETFAHYNNLPPELHIGRTLSEIIPENSTQVGAMISKVFETGESFMNIGYKSAKKSISGLISYYPVRHPLNNEIIGVGVTFQDMTEQINIQNLLRENQDFLTFAQEAGRIGAFEWDVHSNRILWTTELENIYGLSRGEFGGLYESWLKWIHPEDVKETIEEVKKVIDGPCELNYQCRIITKTHDVRWILARGKMVKDFSGKNIKFIGINIDITEQKSIEQKLRVTEANLLHALSVRDEFVAIASHELKTPLQSLKLQIQLQQRNIARRDPLVYSPERIQSILEKNSHHVDRLTRLVDDMLDISRIRTGKLTVKKQPCELSAMLRDILGRTREQFESSGSGQPIIEHIEEAFGEWDPLRIEQVLTNIVVNAIRYGQGKPITIAIKNYQESVRISVKDQGLGIPKSDQEKIFRRYERGMLAREVSGLGLGLFITQQIVDAHYGKIWVESEVGQGATFFVDLPRTNLCKEIISHGNHQETTEEV